MSGDEQLEEPIEQRPDEWNPDRFALSTAQWIDALDEHGTSFLEDTVPMKRH